MASIWSHWVSAPRHAHARSEEVARVGWIARSRTTSVDAWTPPRVAEADRLVVVRACRRREMAWTSAIHERSLATGFFPKLGRRFLRAYHASFAASPYAVLLVAEGPDGPIGFLAGTLDNERHYRWVARHRGPVLAVVGMAALVRDLRLLREFARTRARRYVLGLLRRLRRQPVVVTARCSSSPGDGGSPRGVAVLTHVAVAPTGRRCGAGRALVAAYEDLSQAAGSGEARLITQVDGTAPAFYRALGWRSSGTRTASDGSLVEEFRRPLVDG